MANPQGIGGVKPGEIRNPEGKNGHLEGWMRYGDRIQKWMALPAEELKAYVENEDRLLKLSVIDVACVRHAVGMIFGKETLAFLNAALDRIEGKPKQTVSHGGDPTNPTPISMDGTFTLTFGTEDNDGSDPAA